MSVCLSVHSDNMKTARSQFFVHVACGCDSILLWWCCDTLFTSVLWMTSCLHTVGSTMHHMYS